MPHLILWGQFVGAALLVIFSGYKLTKYGDILSHKLKLGHAFIGAVLIGWSTSLPELVLSIGTTSYAKVAQVWMGPDIAMGNVLGSNLFNLLIIVFLDIYYWKGPILRSVSPKLTVASLLSLIMVILVGGSLYLQSTGKVVAAVPFLNMGYDAVIVFACYLLCMFVLYKNDKKEQEQQQEVEKYGDTSLKALAIKCFFVVAIIVVAGLWLSALSPKISKMYSLQNGFVGTFFLAIVSSLPEVITCFVAVRMGFNNMALGTLFGSNIFNMAIIAFCDIFYRDGNIFTAVCKASHLMHLSSVIGLSLMTVLTIYILRFCKRTRKGWFVGFESILMAAIYLLALYFIYNPSILKPFLG